MFSLLFLLYLILCHEKEHFLFPCIYLFLPQPPFPFQHCPLDIFQCFKLWRLCSCYVLTLFMLVLQSTISWSCVDHFHYLVIWLIDKNTSSVAHNVLFCALFLVLIVVFRLFFLPYSPMYSTLKSSSHDPFSLGFFLLLLLRLFSFSPSHISCTSFYLF